MIKIITILIFLMIITTLTWAGIIKNYPTPAFTNENCIQAIVGEYAKYDYKGMGLMAHAIRNRGTLKGVFGFYAAHVQREPKNIWVNASLAWFESKTEKDPLHGADEWRSSQDVERNRTPKHCKFIKFYNGIYFYKNLTQL